MAEKPPLNEFGTEGEPAYGERNPPPSVVAGPTAPAAPAITYPLPTTPPAPTVLFGAGSATELRKARDKVQKTYDDLQAKIAARDAAAVPDEQGVMPDRGPDKDEQKQLDNYLALVAKFDEQISSAESKQQTVFSGTSPKD